MSTPAQKTTTRHFSGPQKAAIILIALGNQSGSRLLQTLDPQELKRIMAGASDVGTIARNDLELLINEFVEEFARSSGLSGDAAGIRAILETAFPDGGLETILEGPRAIAAEPVWGSFGSGSEHQLAPYLTDEHPQTAAYILSALPGALAARIMALLPRPFRASVAARLLKLRTVAPMPAKIVEEALRLDLCTKIDPSVARSARARVAAIMNEMDREDAGNILEQLRGALPDDVRALQAMMFAFEDIIKLEAPARAMIFDKVRPEKIVPALLGTTPEFREAILSTLGQRARRMAESELATAEGPTAETIPAQREIVSLILSLAEKGDIVLPNDDDAAALQAEPVG